MDSHFFSLLIWELNLSLSLHDIYYSTFSTIYTTNSGLPSNTNIYDYLGSYQQLGVFTVRFGSV